MKISPITITGKLSYYLSTCYETHALLPQPRIAYSSIWTSIAFFLSASFPAITKYGEWVVKGIVDDRNGELGRLAISGCF